MSNNNTGGQETLMEHLTRATSNCIAATFACFSNTKEKTIITKLEFDIASRKKAFGVEYINIIEKATEDDKKDADLKACVDKAIADIRKIHEEIKAHQAEVEATNIELEQKTRPPTPKPVPAAATVTTPAPTPVESIPLPVAEAPVKAAEAPLPVAEAPVKAAEAPVPVVEAPAS
jgi:hypothetical protein